MTDEPRDPAAQHRPDTDAEPPSETSRSTDMQHTDDSSIDQHVAAIHPAAADDPAAAHAAMRSHGATSRRLDDAIRSERLAGAARRPRAGLFARHGTAVRRVFAGAAVAAGCALVAIALAPSNDGARRGALSIAPESASAAEVLERAADVLVRDGIDGTGSGPVWYSSQVSVDKEFGTSRFDSWYDPKSGTARFAISGTDVTNGSSTLYVLEAREGNGTTIRQYRRVPGEPWKPESSSGQMNEPLRPGTDAALGMPPGGSVETATLAWLREVEGSDDPRELEAATKRFMAETDDGMTFDTLSADEVAPLVPDDPEAAARQVEEAMFAKPYVPPSPAELKPMQVLHLLQSARINPDAVAQLYRLAAESPQLKRLGSTTVDGRRAERLQLWDSGGLRAVANVLVIDAETGQPLRSEDVPGIYVTTFAPARRVDSIGSGMSTCGDGPKQAPCDLILGVGPIAAAADELAAKRARDDEAMANDVPAGVTMTDGGPVVEPRS